MKVGFVGLGIVGAPMAGHLAAAGHEVFGTGRSGLPFASRAGADPARVREALMGGLATSRILEVDGRRMIERSFEPGFSIEPHQEDLSLAPENARGLGLALPGTADAQALFSACAGHGGRAWDHSTLVRAREALSGHAIGDAAAEA